METMKIAFDGKRAVRNMTGLGNYSRLVIDVLSRTYPDNSYHLYTPSIKDNPRLEPLLHRNNVSIMLPDTFYGHRLGSLWRSINGLSRQLHRDGMSLFHGLSNELPMDIIKAEIPSVLTMHDVIFRRMPECYGLIDRNIYDFKARRSCNDATRIIAISECTKRDLIEYYNINPDKIDVVYQGCDPIFSRPISDEDLKNTRTNFNLPERYIISVGTIETRKNQALAVKALPSLPKDVKLVIVGRRSGAYGNELDRLIAEKSLSNRVIFLNNVPFNVLPILMKGAMFASYTSRYEGFGLPVIEAVTAGTPVIAATGSCLEEAGGPGAFYVNADNVDDYTEHALTLINDPYLGRGMVTAGRDYMKRFNHENFAHAIMETYIKAMK